jgi:hypothetical protein
VRTVPFVTTLVLLLAPLPALAWKQTLVSSGCGERWLQTHLTYWVQKPAPQGIDGNAYVQAIDKAFATWQGVACGLCATGPNQAPKSCPAHASGWTAEDLGFKQTPNLGPACIVTDTAKPCHIQPNGNFIVAVDVPPDGTATSPTNTWNFGANVVSTTVITANLATGEIVDADIALDAGHHAFCLSDGPGGCKPGQFDLCSTLTHEVGHFLGLDHSLVPDATMYASAPAQESKKCDLAPDDEAGLCTTYATTCNPALLPKPGADASSGDASDAGSGSKTPAPSGCCSTRAAPVTGGAGAILGGLGLLACLAVRRRWA